MWRWLIPTIQAIRSGLQAGKFSAAGCPYAVSVGSYPLHESTEDEELLPEIRKGLQRQLGFVGQFDPLISARKSLCFLSWRVYGHDLPPKVMWV